MGGLPKLPGFTFYDPTFSKFHRSQTFDIRNGYKQAKTQYSGIGGRELAGNSVKQISLDDPIRFDPSLTYGRCKAKPLPQFVPHFALYDQKCLTFKAFFRQSVMESPLEFYRVRPVNIIYFLSDDTILVVEPRIENSGLPQGKLVQRGKIPKNDNGSYWHWKDLQVGKDLLFYGIVYHTVDCDVFTREYMASQGLDMAETEEMPHDPYTYNRKLQMIPKISKTPPADNKFRKFLEYDGKVLRFKAAWDDRNNPYGELMKFEIFYFLCDDTVMVKNVHEENNGRDPYPILLKKVKLPKVILAIPTSHPAIYLENADTEVLEYYQPRDFLVGSKIFVLGRDMILYDCDKFTRDYYRNAFYIEQKPPISIEEKTSVPSARDGLRKLKESLEKTLTLIPKTPKKDVLKQTANTNKYLRYEMKMDAAHPEDTIRRFVLFYSLADGTCKIQEPPIKNSGIPGGKYLRSTLLAKPDSDPLTPEFYTAGDFYIGATIIVFGQRFIITGADLYVYRYMIENCSKFSCESIENMRNWMCNQGYLKNDFDNVVKDDLEAIKKFDESIDQGKSDVQKSHENLNVGGGAMNPELETIEQQKIPQEYEKSIKHTYKVPPHGTLPAQKVCAQPAFIVKKNKNFTFTEDIEANYASYTPKHIDTPEEMATKYYARVVKDQQEVCDKRYPIKWKDSPLKEPSTCEKEKEKAGPLIVSPSDISSESCKLKSKIVRFSDTEQGATDRDDLCDLKGDKDGWDSTTFQKDFK
ncbi:EF-hand domain-containing protein 1-like [Euwallacea similis]|uniref:EF-hand domain-containing protein 1-like n=1 Tax=Euwallacea similis TaxID=1736056 RepID=UPI00344B025B